MSDRGVDHTDSLDSHDSNTPKKPEKKSRRPPNTAFRQQRLKAWQPILTPKTVLPLFFTIGIIFAPIGGLLLYANSKVQEVRLDYTDCTGTDVPNYKDGFGDMPSSAVHTSFRGSEQQVKAKWAVERNVNVTVGRATTTADRCYLQFTTPEDMSPPVLFYYYLTNFYQNHRRYAESMDPDQLKGTARSYSDISSSKCTPLYGAEPAGGGDKKPYYPCGLIANSMFNDSYTSPQLLSVSGGGNETVFYNMTDTGIAWNSDKELYGETKYNVSEILPPPNWQKRFPENYTTDNPPPNLKEWEAFQVWMRTAGLPTFSKLYQRNDTTAMKAGTYQIVIDYHFPVQEYKGTKSVLITTRTVMGGKNPFLGIAYIAVGGVCILLGAVFTATHLFRPRKLGDHTYLSWNNAPASKPSGPATAMATGREQS